DARGQASARRVLARPEGVLRAAVWAEVVDDRLALWIPAPGGGGDVVSWPLAGGAAPSRVSLGGDAPPRVVGATLFAVEGSGTGATATMALRGVDVRTGATVAQVPLSGVPPAAGASLWRRSPTLVAAIGRQEP